MTTPPEPVGRHRAPALWLVAAAIGAAVVAALLDGVRPATTVLVATLAGCAALRLVVRGRKPEGIAVRSPWVDALVLLALAAGIGVLMLSPGVEAGTGGF